jgi:arylsulfatase A-like enzyme/Flp pilus assembly protein TadD
MGSTKKDGKHQAPRTRRTRRTWRTGRTWLLAVVVLAIAAAGVWWNYFKSRGPHAFVLISIDTLRADRLPDYGYAAGRTPHLAAFARESVLFERAFAHAPQTLPSHASMFTGLLPFEHKVRDNLGFTLAPGQTTLAAIFQNAGFATGGFVSAYVLRPQTGVSQGFQTYDATLPAAAADRSPAEILRAGPDTLAATAKWLGTRQDERVFLFFHIYEPHAPYVPPAQFAQPDKYDGEVAYSDDIVGRLFGVLRERGWYDNATIVVTSDHGEGLGDHQEKEHGLFLYNETIRVPLIVKLPGAQHGGSRVAEPVQHIDLLPTLAALAGLQPPGNLRGRNLAPLFGGRGAIAPQGIYAEAMYPRYHFGWSDLALLTDGRYKFIKAPRPELYDLDRDPGERTNIVGDRASAAAALQNGLESILAKRSVDAPSAVSAEDRSRLAALGYVGAQAPRVTTPGESLPDPKDKVGVLLAYREAVNLVGSGQYEAGLAALRTVVTDSPDMIDVWLQIAGTNVRLGRLPEAYQAYREVIRRKPDESGALLGASAILLAMGKSAEARAYAELAVPHAPAPAHQALANIAVNERRVDEALKQADLAAQADPGLPLPAFVRGMFAHQDQRYADAVKLLLQARDGYATRTSQPADLNYFIGDALARLERHRDAEPFFREELRLYPQNIKAAAGLAMLFQVTDRPQDADGMIQAMLRAAPNPESYARAAELYQMFGRPDRAAAVRAQARARFGK